MPDTFSKEKRSSIMRSVKSKGNKSTELKLINFFKLLGIIGWRRNYKLFGNPDFVFPSKKIAVFVDGCFWHGHRCRNTRPSNNQNYWQVKQEKNKKRDEEVTFELLSRGWLVIRIWECELKTKNLPALQEKLELHIPPHPTTK